MMFVSEPRLEIVVQPKTHGQRFRYKCESRSAGCLIGEGSSNETKVFPTVEVFYLKHLSSSPNNGVALFKLLVTYCFNCMLCIFSYQL